MSMFAKRERTTYYVSDLVTGMVSIIDGESFSIIKEIEIGPVPRNIFVDENNNVYIASDRNSKVTLIHDLYDIGKTWNMPNNGNIQVDYIQQKIYVCNTEEVCIYNSGTGEKIATITGFSAADCLRLDREKKKLFILDILQNEIKVYDTIDFHLIRIYKNVGSSPSFMIISADGKYIYITNKGVCKGNHAGSISILELESGNVSFVNVQKGSTITALEQYKSVIYAINSGLHRIEVIDLITRKSTAIIMTTLPELQRLIIADEGKTLLVTSWGDGGKGAIDRIDTINNVILDTLAFKQNNSYPYDIGVVSEFNHQEEIETFILYDSEDKLINKNGTEILARKVLSTYQEKIILPEVITKVNIKDEEILYFEGIIFEQCQMITETKQRKILEHRKDYSIIQYSFFIPYSIELKNNHNHKYVVKGRLEGMQKATLYIPAYTEQLGVQLVANSFTNLASTPVIIDGKIKFAANVLISTKVIVDEVVFIPLCKDCKWWQMIGQREEVE
jgi:hypothetical protein